MDPRIAGRRCSPRLAKGLIRAFARWERSNGGLEHDKAKWAALVVEVTEHETTTASRYGGEKTGLHETEELTVISLARRDQRTPIVFREISDEHWPTGAGHYSTYELVKGGEIHATNQRDLENESACIRPPPTKTRFVLDEDRRFQRAQLPPHSGC